MPGQAEISRTGLDRGYVDFACGEGGAAPLRSPNFGRQAGNNRASGMEARRADTACGFGSRQPGLSLACA